MIRLTESQKQQALKVLQELVRIPSISTPAPEGGAERAEESIARFLTETLQSLGMSVEWRPVRPGRPNIVAHWPEQTGPRTLALEAHMDTVGVEQMTIAPFAGQVRDGRLYGRGACDTKGAIAAFLTVLRIVRQTRQPLDAKLYFVATMGEETGCDGASILARQGFRADAVVVGEPTNCRVATAHKGALWLKLIAHGTSSHASMPERGHNAISAMNRALISLEERFIPQLQKRTHPLLGTATLSAGTIRGGEAVNIVPARCEAELDCRFLPGQDPDQIVAALQQTLTQQHPDERFELSRLKAYPALQTRADRPWVRSLLHVVHQATGQGEPIGVAYFSDAGPFCQAGMETVLFGPGDPHQAHTADESLELEQLYLAAEIMLTWLAREHEQGDPDHTD